MTALGGEAVGKPGVAGVYTNQRLNLSKPWEGLRKTCQGFKPDSGNLTVRDYRGASENVRHGETVNPPAIERAGAVTPHLQRGASDFYPSGPDFWCAFEDGEGMVIGDEPDNTR